MKLKSLVTVALAAGLGGAGEARAADRFETDWASRPTAAQIEAAYAPMAKAGVAGRAAIQCAVLDSGALDQCRLILDQPAGGDYGKALLALAPKYKRKPPGKADARTVNLTLDWHPLDTPPDWLRKPSPEDLIAVFPRAALARGIGGRAVVSCVATEQGALRDCIPLEESPANTGFGSAAVALTPQFMMKPARLKGQPVVSTVNIPIIWPAMGALTTFGSKKVVQPELPWAEAPSYADVAAAYPKKAREAKMSGHATLACDLNEEGRLTGCDVGDSEPRGYGFDTAAKALARKFRFQVTTEADRKATHSVTIHLPVMFDPAMLTDAPPRIGKPRWASLPSTAQTLAAFSGLKVSGTARVTLECKVEPGGGVTGCQVVGEEPAGTGMGAAAISLAPAFRLTTWTAEGLPTVGGFVRIPLRYDGAAPAAPASK